jgi:hypothetical protein
MTLWSNLEIIQALNPNWGLTRFFLQLEIYYPYILGCVIYL